MEISLTTLLQIGIVVALFIIPAVFFQHSPSASSRQAASQSRKKAKRKKKPAQTLQHAHPSSPSVASSSPSSSLVSSVENLNDSPSKHELKRSKQKGKSAIKPSSAPRSDQEFRSLNASPLSSNASQSHSPATHKPTPRPFAERMLPETPHTRVDDMLDADQKDNTKLARVMRIGTDSEDIIMDDGPTTGTSEDDGWTKIPSVTRRPLKMTPSNASNSIATKNSFAVQASPSHDILTKKQRQNQAKKQREKEAEEVQRAEQEARLRQHQRALESARIKEYYDKGPGSRSSSSSKETSGGMRATVNEAGQLVWE